MRVDDATVNVVEAVDPKVMVDVAVKPVPVIVTSVPPAVGPTEGLTAVTVGTGS
jgi:hypothetical protein